jgi:cobalt-zinc-cadmium efflux system outer membrane protein
LLVNRQALDAERELIDALADFHNTRIELEQAAGWPQEGPAR